MQVSEWNTLLVVVAGALDKSKESSVNTMAGVRVEEVKPFRRKPKLYAFRSLLRCILPDFRCQCLVTTVEVEHLVIAIVGNRGDSPPSCQKIVCTCGLLSVDCHLYVLGANPNHHRTNGKRSFSSSA